jgi:hypothetical protein
MAIDRSEFAVDCVRQSIRFAVNAHYLLACAQLRSGISDQHDGERFSVFRITQLEWDANCSDAEYEINDFLPEDVQFADMQCVIYALMTRRAQERLLARLGRYPSSVEFYREQWPDHAVEMPADMQKALDATRDLLKPAVIAVLGQVTAKAPTLGSADDEATDPPIDRSKPVPAQGEQTFVVKAPRIMEKLINDFDLKDFQAAGVLGNIGHECAGFRLMQEVKPLGGGRGGFGWCQWTGSRRRDFEAFCDARGLGRTSDAANYGFLAHELQTTHSSSLDAVKATANIKDAVREFEQKFERAHKDHKHYPRRDRWAALALASFERLLPAAVAKLLDPDLLYAVAATATKGAETYWVVDQFTEGGSQVLIRLSPGQEPTILHTDTTVFPLPSGIVPADVEAELAKAFKPGADEHTPSGTQPPTANDQVAALVFAEAKKADETLVSRNAPNTNNGRLACAWAVNEVVNRAIGSPVGGGLSTIQMSKALVAKHREVSESEAGPGMVVISPTEGKNVGHVGIVGADAVIYSNSSKRGVFTDNFTIESWKAFYKARKNLSVKFYALNAP